MKKQCIVLIPIYQEELNSYERQSVINTISKFSFLYDVKFITNKSFNLDEFYKKNYIDNQYRIDYIYYDNALDSISSYNKLLMDVGFYEFYNQFYKYMLIVQTDAYVFDQFKILDYINKEYMFIGAPVVPWNCFELFFESKRGIYYNGGLSLRNIEKCIECLNDQEFQKFFYKNNSQHDEDIMFSIYEQEHYKSPTYLEALNFSIDNQFELYAPILDFKQPFGVHHFWNNDDNGFNKLEYLQKLKWI